MPCNIAWHAFLASYCFEGIQMREACVKESRKAIKCQECWHCAPPTKLKAKAKLPIHLVSVYNSDPQSSLINYCQLS